MEYFKVMRVGSWLGWVISFGFGSILLVFPSLERFLVVLFAFSFATASVFILNQYFDRKEDQENAFKSNLPVAAGRMTPRTALIFSFLLIVLCLVLVVSVDVNLLSLFLIYLVFGTLYSSPLFRLKNVPVADFLVQKMRVTTFVVRYGRKNGVVVAGFMFLLAGFSPFVYSVLGLLSYKHLFLFFILFPLSVPIIKCYVAVLKKASTKNVIRMQKTAIKYGIIGATVMFGYTLLVKTAGFCFM